MVWFRVDDSLCDHPKLLALQERKGWEAAVALWTLAGAWSSKHLKDGEIPRAVVTRLGFTAKSAELLVAEGFWERAEAGYRFHDWQSRNPLRSQVEREREVTRNRVAKHRGNGVGNGVTDGVSTPVCTPAPSRPVPSQPIPHTQRARFEAPPPAEPDSRDADPPADLSAEAELAQRWADHAGKLLANGDDMHSARGIVRQVGDRWPAVFETWLADEWVRKHRPPLSHLDKHAHKYTSPAPVDTADLDEQIRRQRVAVDSVEYSARLAADADKAQAERVAADARAVLEQLRARKRRVA
jgi:hypothetical protein